MIEYLSYLNDTCVQFRWRIELHKSYMNSKHLIVTMSIVEWNSCFDHCTLVKMVKSCLIIVSNVVCGEVALKCMIDNTYNFPYWSNWLMWANNRDDLRQFMDTTDNFVIILLCDHLWECEPSLTLLEPTLFFGWILNINYPFLPHLNSPWIIGCVE